MSRVTKDSNKPGIPHSKTKSCWCGGHNDRNVKSNLNHHGTRVKLYQRQGRKESENG